VIKIDKIIADQLHLATEELIPKSSSFETLVHKASIRHIIETPQVPISKV
jgi:hypothetical protein